MQKQEFNIIYKPSFWLNIVLELVWGIYFGYRIFLENEIIRKVGFGFLGLLLVGFAWGTLRSTVKSIYMDEELTITGYIFKPKVFSKSDIKNISSRLLTTSGDKYVMNNTAVNELMVIRLLRFCDVENPIEAYKAVVKGKKVYINDKSDPGNSSGSLRAQ